ncbi:MAG: aldose epimerase family protein [Chitinophagaceae bacterium]
MKAQETQTSAGVFKLKRGSLEVKLTNYGATIMSIITPDLRGVKANVVAGFDNPDEYLTDRAYLGSVIGRFSNRISGGKFHLDGQEIQLSLNEKINQLHGGFEGFNRKVWDIIQHDDHSICFHYLSEDGEEGFPGNLDVRVMYTLTPGNSLKVEYSATTDKPTIISLTNHSYFNLSGFENPTIHEHLLRINADSYTEKNKNNTTTGEILPVKNTALDFSNEKPLGEHINELVTDMGYDHNYVLKNDPSPAARLYDPLSGRSLHVYTDQPGLQVYTANWWDGSETGTQGKAYKKHGAVALETQALPDSPNHPLFPSVVLRPGEIYNTYTIFEFSTG